MFTASRLPDTAKLRRSGVELGCLGELCPASSSCLRNVPLLRSLADSWGGLL